MHISNEQAVILRWIHLAQHLVRIEPSKVYSTEESIDTEEYVVSKGQTQDEANLNKDKICDEANMEEKDVIDTKKYDITGENLK